MSSAVVQLEEGLCAMLNLKPPGVTGSKIQTITALCVENVQSESVLIQKIYTHFKKTPGTHKLGVLYVVDSVTRRWIDLAKQQGQMINSSAADGTYAAGVHRVTELVPVLMNDIFQSAPEDQKEKLRKLIDIWEKGQTFPLSLIQSFKEKLNKPRANDTSTTPNGTPPPGPGLPGINNGLAAPKAASSEAPNVIMEALANIARQNTTATASAPPTNAGMPLPSNPYNVASYPQQNGGGQPSLPVTQSQAAYPYSAAAPAASAAAMPQPVSQAMAHAMPLAYRPHVPPQGHAAFMPVASSQLNGFQGFQGSGTGLPPSAAAADPALQQQLVLIKALVDQGIPIDKIPALLATMQGALPVAPPAAVPAMPHPAQGPYPANAWGQLDARLAEQSRDSRSFQRSPTRFRSRSRSPSRQWDTRDSSRGRNERNDRGGVGFGRDSPSRGQDRRGGRSSEYRQRSPANRRGRSPSHDRPIPGPKLIEFDRSLPAGHIKVLSRTLFVGGVTCPDHELRSIFGQHGLVQTCIVNKDKRHAFVKMITRRDAIAAKDAMESGPFRTRWGVGFGPRDCSDYQTGISVIPISKLTEADRKWMLSADFGGSGGRPIETGMVVEEPDIEIGAGVSSKAISRRMQTDRGGRHGPKSSRDDDENRWRRGGAGGNGAGGNAAGGNGASGNGAGNRRDSRENPNPYRDDRIQPKMEPDVVEFPYGITTDANGMPIFPPGFAFPAPQNE